MADIPARMTRRALPARKCFWNRSTHATSRRAHVKLSDGADSETRTHTPCGTAPSRQRVYQFHHIRGKMPQTGIPVAKKVAERTGLEPATPGVTGRYSNQLNYRSKTNCKTKGLDASDLALHGRQPPAHALAGVPKGIRTPVTAVKGRCPRPLDDGDLNRGGHSTCPDKKPQSVSYPGRRQTSRWRSLFGGGKRDRTADLLHAMQALSQLSYTPP